MTCSPGAKAEQARSYACCSCPEFAKERVSLRHIDAIHPKAQVQGGKPDWAVLRVLARTAPGWVVHGETQRPGVIGLKHVEEGASVIEKGG